MEIRPLTSWDEYLQCEAVQRIVWQMPDDREVVPAHLLITADKNGGVLLGAFDGPRLVGFVFGFLGAEGTGKPRRFKHCSHLLAVLAEYRGRGVGHALKQAQREAVLAQGLELITWTYDPLQLTNARLNLNRLGAIGRRYLRDAYGKMTDGLNWGVSSDRFEVEWWLSGRAVSGGSTNEQARARPDRHTAVPLLNVEFDANGHARVLDQAACEGASCLVEIPHNWNALKARDLGLARAWRAWTRSTFETAFAAGYEAVALADWVDEAGRDRCGYLLLSTNRIRPD